jgi:transcriptional regulator with XRE-family HTH domain
MTLREYRTVYHISLDDLAEKTGITKATLSNLECGGGCRLKTAATIVAFTKGEVSYEDLLVDPAAGQKDENGNGEQKAG